MMLKPTVKLKKVSGWMVGLNWKNAFIDGNKLGLGFGSYSSYATEMKGDRPNGDDENFAIEAYYDYQVSDNITITPAIFWVEDADGASIKLMVLNKPWRSCQDNLQVLIHLRTKQKAPLGALFFGKKKGGHLPP